MTVFVAAAVLDAITLVGAVVVVGAAIAIVPTHPLLIFHFVHTRLLVVVVAAAAVAELLVRRPWSTDDEILMNPLC